ncbi:MAG: acyl-CoA reductase [Saprospiraceae bacterium]
MTLEQRLKLLIELGNHLRGEDELLQAWMKRTEFNNGWFTLKNQRRMIDAIGNDFLAEDKLRAWVAQYDIPEETADPQLVGLVMAGNIPLVGFHDLLCTFVTGHYAQIKMSDKDRFLLPYLIKLMTDRDAAAKPYFQIVPRLNNFEAVIATGSNNSARYFESYFGKYPNIIRRNRNGVAVLTGEETHDELHELGKDIFRYFGLGCRNVSKIYVPEGYDFDRLLKPLHEYRKIVLNSKYKNNFDYSYALMILNKVKFKANGAIILTENKSLQSGIANVFYEYYSDKKTLAEELKTKTEEIQVLVSQQPIADLPHADFGKAQEPRLDDYADGVDTLAFLVGL